MPPRPTASQRRNAEKAEQNARAIEALRRGASVEEAAKAAGIARETLWRRRQQDEQFALAYHDAVEGGTDRAEDEAMRRAVDGWDEPVWHQGQQVGVVRKYDSSLLIFLLKARRPEKYRETYRVDQTTTIRDERQAAKIREAAAADPEAFERLSRALAGDAAYS